MKYYWNKKTGEVKDEKQLWMIVTSGAQCFSLKPEQLAEMGWLEIVILEKEPDGYRATSWRYEQSSATTCKKLIVDKVNVAEETATILAAQEAAIAEMNNRDENTDNWTEHERFILWLNRKEEMKPEEFKAWLTEQYKIFKTL